MSSEVTILPNSVSHIPHLAAFDLMVKKRFDELQLDRVLVYLIDTVPAESLPYLAEQFDVLGYKGMRLAVTEADKREIIKRAIELHRFKGTLWAVKESLKSIGFGDAEIVEHVEGHWAKFRINIDLGVRVLSESEINDLIKMVTEYKNERSHLADISYSVSFFDGVVLTDEMNVLPSVDETDTVLLGGDVRHNGLLLRNGSNNYSRDKDVLTIEIIYL